jgi:hypothetical protein
MRSRIIGKRLYLDAHANNSHSCRRMHVSHATQIYHFVHVSVNAFLIDYILRGLQVKNLGGEGGGKEIYRIFRNSRAVLLFFPLTGPCTAISACAAISENTVSPS